MTILNFVQTVYAEHRIDCGREALYQMECAARILATQLGKMPDIKELNESMILRHLRWLKQTGRSPATVQRRRGHLMGIWKVAVKTRHNRNKFHEADIPLVSVGTNVVKAWSLRHLQEMLNACNGVESNDFTGKNWSVLILLIYYTGLRISTILKLKRKNFRGHILTVPKEIQKDKQEMIFRLPEDFVKAVLAQPRPHEKIRGKVLSEMLIPWPWCHDSVQRRFRFEILEPAGLPADDPKLKFHAIRRTVGTMIEAHHGIQAASDVLGHSDISVTRRYIAEHSTVDPSLKSKLAPVDVMPILKIG